MAVAAAILAGIGVSAATSIYSAKKQGQASEQASEQLQQGVREAREYAEPKYAEALRIAAEQHAAGQAGLAPYAQQGGQGLTALTALLGLPAAPVAAAPAARAPVAPPASVPAPAAVAPTRLSDVAKTLTPDRIAQLNLATGGGFEAMLRREAARSPAAPATSSSYVSLRAPTGDVRPVPADQVDFYLARGATRV